MEFSSSLTRSEIKTLVQEPGLNVLQTSAEVEPKTWQMLNDLLLPARPEIELRIYGFYKSVCDLSFLACLPNLRHFSADCLMRATAVESVAQLPNLQSLSIEIDNLQNFDFLESLPNDELRKLSLGATKSRKPTLRHLRRYGKLQTLRLDGQQKDIEIISKLSCLESLTLRCITLTDLAFLRDIPQLQSLSITLGGTNNLSALAGMDQLQFLELRQIRGLSDLSAISSMHGLRSLFLENLPHVTAIPDLSRLRALRKIVLDNLKGLKNISSLAQASELEELNHASANGIAPAHYAKLLTQKTLKQINVGFGSNHKNIEFQKLLPK